ALVYYFGTKERLLLDVVGQGFEALGTAVEAAVVAESAPDARLRAYAETYLAHIDTHRHNIAAAVAIVVAHRDAVGTPLYRTETDEDTALLRSILQAGMDAGVFRRAPIADAVRVAESLLDVVITA